MKVSLNWIKQYIDFELPPVDELVEKIGAQLGAVEEVIDLGARYQSIPIVKVVVCEPLENSDHLSRCLVDDGGVIKDIERNEDGLVQVITGAPNVHAGMLAVWLPPGTTVPDSFDKDPFVLESRPMRGAISHGMLASAKELAIGDSHEGLLDLSGEKTTPSDLPIEPGADFAAVYELNDYIINIENKMFTHRPDCFGQLGVAREIAGILGEKFTSPGHYTVLDEITVGSGLSLEIENEIPAQVPRFMAVAFKDVAVGPSPLWLQVLLARLGAKPISNVVDVTNYVMLLTGQPLHAYDYDRVASGKLGARFAHAGEKLALLNGKTLELTDADMVITDGTKPIGLAGVMGGAETEVSAETKNIILECAAFDMYAIRRTSMRHGLFTDAVTRYNKGQSPLQNPYVAQLAIGHLRTLAGGEQASAVLDSDHTEGRTTVYPPVSVSADFINTRLGFHLEADEMKRLLENVEFTVGEEGENLTVAAPFWRTDIETCEDVVEEVGRLYGFDKLQLELPKRRITPAKKGALLELKAVIRDRLAKAGANEVLTYSFVHGDLIAKTGQDKSRAFRLSNALSPDLQYYRLSLTPSLLERVHPNVKAGHDQFAIFELGKSHYVGEMEASEPEIPNEDNYLSLVLTYGDKHQPAGAPYYQARHYLEQILPLAGQTLVPLKDFDVTSDVWGAQLTAPYDPNRSAVIVRDNKIWGVVGEFKPAVRRALKLPAFVAGFEIHLDIVPGQAIDYTPLPRFPKVTQDMTLKVPAGLAYRELAGFVEQSLEQAKPQQTLANLLPLGIYQSENDADHKRVTFRLEIASYERTMTDKEVNKLLDDAAAKASLEFGAERT